MRHLFNSRVEVLRLSGTVQLGIPMFTWQKITDMVDPALGVAGEMRGRLDLTYQRPGKDVPMPVVAGRAPDRVGVWFFSWTKLLKAGDRLVFIDGPMEGTFELRASPDPVSGRRTVHHGEVQVIEVAQNLQGVYPGAQPEA